FQRGVTSLDQVRHCSQLDIGISGFLHFRVALRLPKLPQISLRRLPMGPQIALLHHSHIQLHRQPRVLATEVDPRPYIEAAAVPPTDTGALAAPGDGAEALPV